jgi:inorganic pyrophosphatase
LLPPCPPPGKRDKIVNVVSETPQGNCHKYALEPEFGIIAYWPPTCSGHTNTASSRAPSPATADRLDMLVMSDEGLFSSGQIAVRVLGAIREKKDGTENAPIIGVPRPSAGAPKATNSYREITDVTQTNSKA